MNMNAMLLIDDYMPPKLLCRVDTGYDTVLRKASSIVFFSLTAPKQKRLYNPCHPGLYVTSWDGACAPKSSVYRCENRKKPPKEWEGGFKSMLLTFLVGVFSKEREGNVPIRLPIWTRRWYWALVLVASRSHPASGGGELTMTRRKTWWV